MIVYAISGLRSLSPHWVQLSIVFFTKSEQFVTE